MKVYADTNILARYYLQVKGHEDIANKINLLAGQDKQPLPLTWLLRLELTNAFQYWVHLSRAEGKA